MNKMGIALTMGLVALGATGAATAAEGEWNWLAGTKEGYKMEPAVSLLFGVMKPDLDGVDAQAAFGLEFSLNCPLIQPPTNKIREQVSFTMFKDGEYKQNSLELSPHYVVEVSKGLWFGGGPGLGVIFAEGKHDHSSNTEKHDDTVFGFQVGASLHYTAAAPFFAGAEARYQITSKANDIGDNLNNLRAMLKVGMSF